MISLRDSHGIIIGWFKDETEALFAMQDVLDSHKRMICSIEQDKVRTHEGFIVGEIRRVGDEGSRTDTGDDPPRG